MLLLPLALLAGIVLERHWPGDFGHGLYHGGPAPVDLVRPRGQAWSHSSFGLLLARRSPQERSGLAALAAVLFVLPVAVHGFEHWSPLTPTDPAALSAAASPATGPAARGCGRDRRPDGRATRSSPPTPSTWSRRRSPTSPIRRANDPNTRVKEVDHWLATGDPAIPRRYGATWAVTKDGRLYPPAIMKVLLVTLYFPPAGGGGVQRPLKFATHLPELGIETHVLAPDDPKWIHVDDELPPPTLAWVHRVPLPRAAGAQAGRGAARQLGLERYRRRAMLLGRKLLVPDENVSYNLTAIPAAIRIVREEGIDIVITTSPPPSIHLIGAAVKRATGVRWVADLRDSIVAIRIATRRPRRRSKEQGLGAVAALVARWRTPS